MLQKMPRKQQWRRSVLIQKMKIGLKTCNEFLLKGVIIDLGALDVGALFAAQCGYLF